METIDSGKVREIFQIINMANDTLDIDLFRREVLHTIAKVLNVDKATFALENEDAGFPDFVHFNVDDKNQRDYQDYYYRHDPFGVITGEPPNCRLSLGPLHEKVVVSLRELISGSSLLTSKYFNHCLRPMNVLHEINVYLKSKDKVRGYIGLFRNERSEDFSIEEVELMRTVSPYLTIALENMDLRKRSDLAESVVEILGENHPFGMIVCNESLNLVYMNQKALWNCYEIGESISVENRELFSIPDILLEDCVAIQGQTKRNPVVYSTLPMRKIVRSKTERYSITTRMLENNMNPGMKTIFIILMEKISTVGRVNEEKIQELFQLTKREAEIVSHLFEGLKNSEIGERLFISEKTVKRHIQNVSDKIGARNRTGIICKVLRGLNVI
jgi:DNA-binding CsgD family transcriptional regulator